MLNPENFSSDPSYDAGWDSLTNTEFSGETSASATTRQQRKIIAGLLTGDYNSAIREHDSVISEDAENDFLDRLASGEISQNDERNFLLNIRDPLHDPNIGRDQTYDKITSSGHEKWILAYMSGYNPTNWQNVDAVDVAKLSHDFPTPIDFAPKAEAFLSGIKSKVSEIEFGAYSSAMESFQHKLYGKRYEYWEQMQELNARAAEHTPNTSAENLNTAELSLIPAEMKETLIANSVIESDTWLQNGQEYQLTPESLDKHNLGPKYELALEGTQICLSDTFNVSNGRLGAIAYIPTKDGVKVRSYYKSNSQGVWRYLPDYVSTGENGIEWYGKSSNEERITLPLKLQESLAKIQENGPANTGNTNPQFLLAGTAYRYSSKDEYSQRLLSGTMRGDLYREVSSTPAIDFGATHRDQKQSPESLAVNPNTSPDFSQNVANFNTVSSLTGNITMESFRSNDGNFEWNFCRDSKNRAWVGGLEVISEITSTGLRKEWASAGDLATPLYEYSSQSAGYGDTSDKIGLYECMWNNYLRKAPIIQQYLRSKGIY